MAAAARDLGVAINWRVTLLGLNLAAWLVGALIIAALFVRHEMTAPPLYPGFGYTLPVMFNDVPVFYPAKVEPPPVVGLQTIGALKPATPPAGQGALAQHQDRGLAQTALGGPRPLSPPDHPVVTAPSKPRQPARP
jgi:hypothetical protein